MVCQKGRILQSALHISNVLWQQQMKIVISCLAKNYLEFCIMFDFRHKEVMAVYVTINWFGIVQLECWYSFAYRLNGPLDIIIGSNKVCSY